MGLLNAQDKKVVDRWFELFAYGKHYSDRQFVQKAVELMSQQVNSELGYRRAIENANREPEIEIKITGGVNLFEEIRKRLQGNQIRKLDDVLKSIKRELPESDYEYLKQPIEAMKKRDDRNKARVLAKYGVEYSQTSRLAKLKQ